MSTYPAFFIPGHPRPKGSWTPVHTKKGLKFRPASNNTADWCRHIKREIEKKWTHELIAEGPIRLELLFLLPRPKTVVRQFPTVRGTGDLDKLERAVYDAMTGIVYKDDAQVCDAHPRKEYTDGEPGVWITISTDL